MEVQYAQLCVHRREGYIIVGFLVKECSKFLQEERMSARLHDLVSQSPSTYYPRKEADVHVRKRAQHEVGLLLLSLHQHFLHQHDLRPSQENGNSVPQSMIQCSVDLCQLVPGPV